jgi:hypothetical protein
MLALMRMRGEEREVDCFAHGRVAGMIGVEIIPGQLGELAVGQIFRLHVAGRGIERCRVEIGHAVIEPGGPDIGVMGATMTSALGMLNPAEGWNPGYTGGGDNGPVVDANRMISTP